jgi:hypothetical protein
MFIILLSLSVRKGGRLTLIPSVVVAEVRVVAVAEVQHSVAHSEFPTDLSPTPWRIRRTQ